MSILYSFFQFFYNSKYKFFEKIFFFDLTYC